MTIWIACVLAAPKLNMMYLNVIEKQLPHQQLILNPFRLIIYPSTSSATVLFV